MRISLYSNKIDLFNNTLKKNNSLSKRDYKLLQNEIRDINIIYKNENQMFEKMTKDLNFRQKLKKKTHGPTIIDDLIKVELKNKYDPYDDRESMMKIVREKKKKITMKIDVEKINTQLKEKYSQKELFHIKPELIKLTLNAIEASSDLVFNHSRSSSMEKNFKNKEVLNKIKNSPIKHVNKTDILTDPRKQRKIFSNTSNIMSSPNDILSTRDSHKNKSFMKTKETFNLKRFSAVNSGRKTTDIKSFFNSLKKDDTKEDSQLQLTNYKLPEDNTRISTDNSNVLSNNFHSNRKKVFLRTSILNSNKISFPNMEDEKRMTNLPHTRESMLQTISETGRVDMEDKKSLTSSPRKHSKIKEHNSNRKSVDIIVGQVHNLSPSKVKRQSHVIGDPKNNLEARSSLITNPTALNKFLIRDFNIGETTDPIVSSKKKMELTTKMFQLKEEKLQEKIKNEREAYEIEKFGSKIKNDLDNQKNESFALNDKDEKLEEEKFEKEKKKLNKRKLKQSKENSRRLVELIEDASKHNYFKAIKTQIPGSFINRRNLDSIILMRSILKHKVNIDDEQMEMSNLIKFKEKMRENDNDLLLMLNKMGAPSFLKSKFRQETVDKFLRVNGKFFGVYV